MAFLSFPTGFIAVLAGWFTAEVGRQPWVVYGLLRTKDAVTPSLTTGDVLVSLAVLRHRLRDHLRLWSIFHLPTFAGWSRARCVGPGENDSGSAAGRCNAILHGGTAMSATDPSALALFWARRDRLWRSSPMSSWTALTWASGSFLAPPRTTALRDEMIASISPFWDGNETWLIVVGATLFAAFPAVYAVFLGAFYIPVLLLLLALIFRGVAFEFRARGAAQGFWDRSFAAGSLVAAFVQGAAVGAMIRGIPVVNGQFSGGSFDWVAGLPIPVRDRPRAWLCAAGRGLVGP